MVLADLSSPERSPAPSHEVEFGVDGTATFRMTRGELETELTVFVPPDEPAGSLPADGQEPREPRPAAAARPLLPDGAGRSARARRPAGDPIATRHCRRSSSRTRATRSAPGRPSSPCRARPTSSRRARGRFFGAGRERRSSRPGGTRRAGRRADAATTGRSPRFLTTLDVPAHGETHGRRAPGPGRRPEEGGGGHSQVSGSRRRPGRPRRDPAVVAEPDGHASRSRPRNPEFDRYLNWLKYQALAERIWARRGFYQASGAYGFRDQLQDSVNLIWMDPAVARRQILLHASQQFLEGDVVHWFHRLQDGRTGFVGADARLGQPPLAGLGRGRVRRGHRRRVAPGRAHALPRVRAALRAPAGGEARNGLRPAPVDSRRHRLPALPEGRSTSCSRSGWAPTGCP